MRDDTQSGVLALHPFANVFGQSVERPRLGPSHVGDPVRQEPSLPEIEESFPAVHVPQHPIHNPVCQILIFVALPGEETDRLGRRMDVHRIYSIVIVFRRTIFEKEILRIIFDSLAISRAMLRGQSRIQYVANGLKIETRVKRVDPTLETCVGIIPGSVIPLGVIGGEVLNIKY